MANPMRCVIVDGIATIVPVTQEELDQIEASRPARQAARAARKAKKHKRDTLRKDNDVKNLLFIAKTAPEDLDAYVDGLSPNAVLKAIVKVLAIQLR